MKDRPYEWTACRFGFLIRNRITGKTYRTWSLRSAIINTARLNSGLGWAPFVGTA